MMNRESEGLGRKGGGRDRELRRGNQKDFGAKEVGGKRWQKDLGWNIKDQVSSPLP